MKRSSRTLLTLALSAAAFMSATPAFAQTYDDEVGGGIAILVFVCWGVAVLLSIALTVVWVWMLIDAIARQEWEYPPGAGTKILWIVLMILLGWIPAAAYYFMVYKKLKRGTVAPPWAQQQGAPGPAGPQPPQAAPPAPPQSQPAPPPPPAAPPAAPQAPPVPPAPPAPPQTPPDDSGPQ